MSRLDEILRVKRDEIEALHPRREELRQRALLRNDFRGFGAAIQQGEGKLALIAEIKKASPSAGVIVESFDPVSIAKNYAHAGVEAISVPTDERFSRDVRLSRSGSRVGPPTAPKKIYPQSAQITGAPRPARRNPPDCRGAEAGGTISPGNGGLYQLMRLSKSTPAELDRALETEAKIIGINNRTWRPSKSISVTET